MTINKKSWHYRLYRYLKDELTHIDTPDPKTLCSYFWGLVGYSVYTSITLSMGCIMLVSILGLLGFGMYKAAAGLASTAAGAIHGNPNEMTAMFAGLGVFAFFVGIVGAIKSCRKLKAYAEANPSAFISVVVNMVLATKNKVCPLVEFKDEE